MAAAVSAARPEAQEGWLTARRARLVAWSVFAAGMVLRLIALGLVSRLGPDSVQFTLGIGPPTFIAAILLGTASGLVGAIIVASRPSNAVGWLYVLTGGLQGVITLGLAYAGLTLFANPNAIATFMAWANGVVDFAIPFSFAALLLALFPDGRLLGPRWRVIVLLAIVGGVIRTLEVALGERTMVLVDGSTNPYRVGGPVGDVLAASAAFGVGSLLVEAAFVLAAISLGVRYRAASLDGRRQIRWLLLAGALAGLSSVPLLYGTIVPGSLPRDFDALSLVFATLCLAPIATLIAITRYRLYEIDRIVNRALLYGSLTAILAGVFTAAVALAQRLFVAMTGEKSDAAIVLTTLVVATLYAPLRKRLEAIVDRRFKFEQPRFGHYRSEIGTMLSLVDPQPAAERLIRETVAELRAAGGAVLASDGKPTASAGTWPATVVERVPIRGGSRTMATIALGARTDGAPYAGADLAELARVAEMAARLVSTVVAAGGEAPR